MKPKEECKWCMSTQDIIRPMRPGMPEELRNRCSACTELWNESHIDCDCCGDTVDLDINIIHYDKATDTHICNDCESS